MNSAGKMAAATLIIAGVLCGALMLHVGLTSSPEASPALSQSQGTSDTQARMRGVFLTLTTAYKYSLDAEAFEDPSNRFQIMSSLQALVANSSELERHATELDESFDHLKRSLNKDALEALRRFEQGQYVGSRWMLNKITENCVTCHSKFPSGDGPGIASGFLRASDVRELEPLARAELQIATRQFDQAVTTYEDLFADPESDPRALSVTSALESYLRLCLVVREDKERPVRTISKLAAREDTPENLRSLLRSWLRSLGRVNLEVAEGQELVAAKELIDQARTATRFPRDRNRQVEFIEASALLHRYLQSDPKSDDECAQAFYLLGVAESHISRSYWISETESLLEMAIRKAPKSAVAKDAYTFLEEYMLSGRSVTAREVPEDVEEHLKELRELIGE